MLGTAFQPYTWHTPMLPPLMEPGAAAAMTTAMETSPPAAARQELQHPGGRECVWVGVCEEEGWGRGAGVGGVFGG